MNWNRYAQRRVWGYYSKPKLRRGKRAGKVYAYETLVRSARTGRLLRVERRRKP